MAIEAGSGNDGRWMTRRGRAKAVPVGALTRVRGRPTLVAPMPNSLARERLASLLRSAAGRRIAIVGDAMLDVYLKGDVERISPEAPVPVVRVRERVLALGGAANVAQNVAALGAIPELVALVGDDPAGTELRRLLAGIGAGAGSLIPTSRPTTTKTRIQARMQQVVRYDEEDDGDVGPADTERALAWQIERSPSRTP